MSRCSALPFVVLSLPPASVLFPLAASLSVLLFSDIICVALLTATALVRIQLKLYSSRQSHAISSSTSLVGVPSGAFAPAVNAGIKRQHRSRIHLLNFLFFMITSFQFKCSCIKLIIFAFFGDQLIVRSSLNNTSLLQHHYNIRIRTVDSLCAITNTVRPFIRASIPLCTIASVLVSIEDVASSRIITGGSATAALAIAIS